MKIKLNDDYSITTKYNENTRDWEAIFSFINANRGFGIGNTEMESIRDLIQCFTYYKKMVEKTIRDIEKEDKEAKHD